MNKIFLNADEIQKIINLEFPNNNLIIENCEYRSARLRLEVNHIHLRPEGVLSPGRQL